MLVQQGYQVLQAGDGVEALAILKKQAVQIVITDWEMPNLDGLQLCRAIRESELSGRLYILFLTSHSEKSQLVEGIDAGADDYLTKPAHPAELSVRVRNGERTLKARDDLEAVNASPGGPGGGGEDSTRTSSQRPFPKAIAFNLPGRSSPAPCWRAIT
jgi:DNA-binding response OmpR family regulator